jgi:tetratricopeptide (TPR) repeat protein
MGNDLRLPVPTTTLSTRVRASAHAGEDPEKEPTPDPLTQAATYLKQGKELQAAACLEEYLREQPHAHLFRIQLAEIYHRCQQYTHAQRHYEYFLWYLPTSPKHPLGPYAVLAHTRLREYALSRQDEFAEAYHRGAGLLLLALSAQEVHPQLADELLGQARQALAQAHSLRPNHPLLIERRIEMHELSGHVTTASWERRATLHSPLPTAVVPVLPLE